MVRTPKVLQLLLFYHKVPQSTEISLVKEFWKVTKTWIVAKYIIGRAGFIWRAIQTPFHFDRREEGMDCNALKENYLKDKQQSKHRGDSGIKIYKEWRQNLKALIVLSADHMCRLLLKSWCQTVLLLLGLSILLCSSPPCCPASCWLPACVSCVSGAQAAIQILTPIVSYTPNKKTWKDVLAQ